MSLEPIRARPLSTTFASIKPAVTQPVADTVARRDVFVTAAAKAEVPGSDIKLLPYFGQFSISSNDNACGTTALSIILASEGLIGREVEDGQAVDNAVRPWGGYSAPRDLTAYAFSKGLSSQSYNKASFDDLAARLKSGNKVLCMVDGPHWIVPLGTYTEPTTGEKRIKYMDPAGGEGSRDVSQKEFEAMWARPNQAVTSKPGRPTSPDARPVNSSPPSYRFTISTRRFCARPASLSFVATGVAIPAPKAVSRAAGMAKSRDKAATTACARRVESWTL